MKPDKLLRRWKDGQARLLTQLSSLVRQARQHGSAEDIHQLRVTARRLRLLTRLTAGAYGHDLSRACRDWTRSLSAATDPVRDLDVALEWLEGIEGTDPVRTRLQRRRQQVWRRRRPRLQPLPAALLKALAHTPGSACRAERLHRRCRRLAQRLSDRIRTDAPRFFQLDVESQHAFRRLVRRWRYLRELELPDARHKRNRQLRQLFLLQQTLGDRQNLHLTDAALAALPQPPPQIPALRQRITRELAAHEKTISRRLRNFGA